MASLFTVKKNWLMYKEKVAKYPQVVQIADEITNISIISAHQSIPVPEIMKESCDRSNVFSL